MVLKKLRNMVIDMRFHVPWSKLRKIGGTSAFKMTPLFPVIGYIILFSTQLRDLVNVWIPGKTQHAATFIEADARLYFLYFGLMFLGASSLIFAAFCPKVIKKHDDETEYAVSSYENIRYSEEMKVSKAVHRHIEDLIMAPGLPMGTYMRERQIHEFASEVSQHRRRLSADRRLAIDVLATYYEISDISSRYARVFCFVFMAIGFACLLIPSADVLVAVAGKVYLRLI